MKDIKVSVIIPVYNVEKYLRQCLDSVVNQTFKDIEIIIVNDCSPDNSLQIIKEYQQKDDRIVLVNLKQNLGLGFARNEGLKIAKGKYITFVDSDDWVTKSFIEVLYNNILKSNCDFVSINCFLYDDVLQTIKKEKEKETDSKHINQIITDLEIKKEILALSTVWSVWSKIFRKDFLIENNMNFQKYIMEDIRFMFEAYIHSNSFMFISNQEYFYRKSRKDSISSNINSRIYKFLEMFDDLKKFLIDKNFYNIYKNSFLTLVAKSVAFEFEENSLSLKESKQIFTDIKHKFFKEKFQFIYTKNVLYDIRLNLLRICLYCNINYTLIARPIKKLFKIFCNIKKNI